MELLLTEDRPYYNIRKRYGQVTAHSVMDYWYHFNVDPPLDQDEAIEYYIFRGKV